MALLKKSVTFTGATTDGEILDPTTGSRWVLHKLLVSTTGTAEITIYDETDASATQIVDQRITDGLVLEWRYEDVPWSERHTLKDGFLRSAAVDNKLEITYSEAVNVFVTIHYTEETS
jgi:hypothetical protein